MQLFTTSRYFHAVTEFMRRYKMICRSRKQISLNINETNAYEGHLDKQLPIDLSPQKKRGFLESIMFLK